MAFNTNHKDEPTNPGYIRYMKTLLLSLVLCTAAFCQTTAPTFPSVPLPTAVSAVASYNQLGTPKWTLGLSVIYPIVGQAGVYGTTTADIYTHNATDPTSGKQFWALSTGIRQGVHKSLLTTGRFTFLLGGDVGPSFSSNTTGVSVNFSSSFVATTVYQVNPIFSVVAPIRMLYVGTMGWNPVVQVGVAINLKNLPK